jgi:hypothetical protein
LRGPHSGNPGTGQRSIATQKRRPDRRVHNGELLYTLLQPKRRSPRHCSTDRRRRRTGSTTQSLTRLQLRRDDHAVPHAAISHGATFKQDTQPRHVDGGGPFPQQVPGRKALDQPHWPALRAAGANVGNLTGETTTAAQHFSCPDEGAAEAMAEMAVAEVVGFSRAALVVLRQRCPVDVVVNLESRPEQAG